MNPVLRTFIKDGAKLRSYFDLGSDSLESMWKALYEKPSESDRLDSPLSGRGKVLHTQIPHFGPVVVKHYIRGGLLRKVVQSRHLRSSKPSRSELEFEMLNLVRKFGVSAPEPIGFATTTGIFYRAWLVMKEIADAQSLAQISITDEDLVRKITPELIRQIQILIRNRIFHLDLHPGNVLIDSSKKVWLIDFDKATESKLPARGLRELYLRRWRRAVIKHKLPDYISELVCGPLRMLDEDDFR